MRTAFLTIFTFMLSLAATAQSKPAAPASAAKKPVSAAAAEPTAIIDTTMGKFTCTLFPKKAPIGVANFIGLSNGTKDWTSPATGRKMHGVPLYSGTIFHRVIPEFMIQGGDPMGTGMGDPGYKFKNETSPDLTFDRPGRLAYANSDSPSSAPYANAEPGTNGSQFFITEVPVPSLDGKYTIFGQCDDPSVELVKKIARLPRDANDRPDNPPKINKITILHAGGTATHAPVHRPTTRPKPAQSAQQK